MCLGVFHLGFILYGILCASWTWLTIFFSILGKFSTIISSKIFSYPFFLFWDPYNRMLVCLILSQRSLNYRQFFSFFLLYSTLQKLFPPFYFPAHWFILLLQIFCYWFLQTWQSNFTFTLHFHALEKDMATHSSVLAWRIPGTEEAGGLLSMGSHRVGHNWSDLAAAAGKVTGIIVYCFKKLMSSIMFWIM